MTGFILGVAESAWTLADEAAGKSQGESGDWKERVIAHWPQGVFYAGSILGLITGVASLILGIGTASALGFLLAATNYLAAHYIKKFRALKALEDSTAALAQKVHSLEAVNRELTEVNNDLQKIPKDWREQIVKGEKKIKRQAQELKKVADKLADAEKKLQALAGVATDIQKRTGELSSAALKFSQENHLFDEQVSRLEKEVELVERRASNLPRLIMETDENTEAYQTLLAQFSGQLQMLDDLFGLMKKLYILSQERMKGLETQVDELEQVIPAAEQSVAEADRVREEMSQMQASYHDLLSKLEEALQAVKKYQKYKEGYRELKALKKNDQWPVIERLLTKGEIDASS